MPIAELNECMKAKLGLSVSIPGFPPPIPGLEIPGGLLPIIQGSIGAFTGLLEGVLESLQPPLPADVVAAFNAAVEGTGMPSILVPFPPGGDEVSIGDPEAPPLPGFDPAKMIEFVVGMLTIPFEILKSIPTGPDVPGVISEALSIPTIELPDGVVLDLGALFGGCLAEMFTGLLPAP